MLSETARLKILDFLSSGESSVQEIVLGTGLNQPHVSRQLAQLTSEGILARRKEGTRVFYSICDDRLARLIDLADRSLREHLESKLGELDG